MMNNPLVRSFEICTIVRDTVDDFKGWVRKSGQTTSEQADFEWIMEYLQSQGQNWTFKGTIVDQKTGQISYLFERALQPGGW